MNHRLTFRWLFSCLLVLAFALQAAPAFAQTDDTAPPDDFIAQLDALRANAPTISESFRVPNADWETDTESTNSFIRFSDRTYQVGATDAELFVWGVSPAQAANFYVETYAEQLAGPVNSEHGIVFRQADTDNFYAFMVSGDGYFVLHALVNNEWTDLVPWTASDTIDQSDGASNLLAVYADGPTLLLLINDNVVAYFEDESFAGGAVGLAAGSFDEGGVEIAFDDFALWDLDEFGALEIPPSLRTDIVVASPTETPSVDPTLEPTSKPTESAVDTAAILDRVDGIRTEAPTRSEDFRRDTGAWAMGDDGSSVIEVARRALSIQVIDDNWLGWTTLQDVQAGDLLVEGDFRLDKGSTDTEMGIIFRYQDDLNFYYFAISGQGSFSLWRLVDNQWESVVPWTTSDAVDGSAGATNRLSVLAEGDAISLLVNDQVVGAAQDSTFVSGLIGLAVGTFDTGDAVVFADNIDLWVLSAGATAATTPEPQNENTPEAQATPVPEGTLEPEGTPQADMPSSEEAIARAATVRADAPTSTSDFRRDDGTWSIEAEDGVEHAYARRSFHITVASENWVSWTRNLEIDATDFLVEVDTAHVAGPQDAEYGVVFRYVDDENLYLYAISADGYYSLFKREAGQWTPLAQWTPSDALNTGAGALNRLGVLAEGTEITLFANETALTTVSDDSFASGQIGLAAGTFVEPGIEVAFDNFSFWEIGGN